MFKIIINFFFVLVLLLEVNLCAAKDTSLVIYQRNSFCKLILYSAEQHPNKNKFIIEAIEDVTPVYSINTLGRIGGLAWPQDAVIFPSEGVLKLHEQYFNNMKDTLKGNQNIIHLKSIVISIAGYNTNKDNTDIFQDKLIEKLAENNFTVNTNNITFIDDEDFIRQSGLEALKDSCLDKKNYNSILVSLQTDHATNYRIFNHNQNAPGQSFIANKELTGGYTQLGKDTQKFFANIPENYLNYDKDNKVLDKILSSQLNTDLFNRQGDNLAHWLQNGRDSVRGLAIMKYLLVNDAENKPVNNDNNTVNQQAEDLNTFLDSSLIKILESCISNNINNLYSLVNDNDYAIVFGEFLSNKYIKAKYIAGLNAKFNEQKRRRILVLNDEEFHHALIKSAEKIKTANNCNKEDDSMFFHFKLYTQKPEVNTKDNYSKLQIKHLNDFTKNLMRSPLLDALPLLYPERSCPFLLGKPLCECSYPECYHLKYCNP